MDLLFKASINFILNFLDPKLEAKYIKLKQKEITPSIQRFLIILLFALVVFLILSILGIVQAVQKNPQYSLFHELFQFTVIISSLILETIVYCIENLYFLRGTILNVGIFVYITDISYANSGDIDYLNAINFPFLILTYAISFSYTRSWISSNISVAIGVTYYLIMSIVRKPLTILQILYNVISCLYIEIVFITSFYQEDIQNRQDFFYFEMSKKKNRTMKTLFKELPIPLVVKYPTSTFINEPFSRLFFADTPDSNRSAFQLNIEQTEPRVTTILKKIKEKHTGKTLFQYMQSINEMEDIHKLIFVFFDEELQMDKELQVKGLIIPFDNEDISILIFNNLTEFKNLEKQIEQKYQNMLIASFSHDIITPINGCIGLLSKLSKYNLNLKAQKIIKNIHSCCLKLLYFIDHLKDYTYIESTNLNPIINNFNANEPIKELLNIFEWEIHSKRLELNVQYNNCTNCILKNDFTRIKEILFVFLTNAIKYTMKGGITISLSHDHDSEEYYYSVIDTGIGIEEERLDTIFNLFGQQNKQFTSLNPQGIGLGLYVSNKLSKILNGQIILKSQINEGSNFSLCIKPLDINEMEVRFKKSRVNINEIINPQPLEEIKEIVKKCDCPKYLIVDDDTTNRKVLKYFVKSINEKGDQACNGEEAIQKVFERSNSICCKNYNIIFMDINMPVMDGVEATKILKKHISEREIPPTWIIAITAAQCTNQNDLAQFKSVGFDGFYQKPLTKKMFNEIIEKYH